MKLGLSGLGVLVLWPGATFAESHAPWVATIDSVAQRCAQFYESPDDYIADLRTGPNADQWVYNSTADAVHRSIRPIADDISFSIDVYSWGNRLVAACGAYFIEYPSPDPTVIEADLRAYVGSRYGVPLEGGVNITHLPDGQVYSIRDGDFHIWMVGSVPLDADNADGEISVEAMREGIGFSLTVIWEDG